MVLAEVDANLTITPAEATGTKAAPKAKESARLELIGAYRPPLGRLGATLDQAILHRAAAATIRSLLRTVAAQLTEPATATSSATLRPWPEAT